jgi:hypothetical protein
MKRYALVLCFLIGAVNLRAQEVKFIGYVREKGTERPIKGVEVSAGEYMKSSALTRTDGGFTLLLKTNVAIGTMIPLHFEKTDYDPMDDARPLAPDYAPTFYISRTQAKAVGTKPHVLKPRFKEHSGEYNIAAGSMSVTLIKQPYVCPLQFGEVCPVKGYLLNGDFVVDTNGLTRIGRGEVEVVANELRNNSPDWDSCFDDTALEVVDEHLIPVFQLIYTKANNVLVNGIFYLNGQIMVLTPQRWRVFISDHLLSHEEYPIKPLFNYPSRTSKCAEVSASQKEPSQTGDAEVLPRILSSDQIAELEHSALLHPARAVVFYDAGDEEEFALASQISNALNNARWSFQIPPPTAAIVMGPPQHGMLISWHGEKIPQYTTMKFDNSTAWGTVAGILGRAFPQNFFYEARPEMEPNLLVVHVYHNPGPRGQITFFDNQPPNVPIYQPPANN